MIKKKTHKILYKQRLHVKKKLKKFLNSIKLFLLFSTEISSTEMSSTELSRMFSTEMSWYRRAPPPLPPTLVRLVKELILMLLIKIN